MTWAHRLYLDTEVKAPQPKALDNWGLDRYARHPATRVLLFAYAIDDGPVQLWDCYHTDQPPVDLVWRLKDPHTRLIAHNAQFDRVVLMHRLGLVVPYERWYCTRARAYAHGLPGDLDLLSKIFKLGDDAKLGERGAELIQLFCEQGADPDAYPVEWLEFCDYAIHDITALRALEQGAMPGWCFTEFEQRVYALDQKINDRGFMVDLPLAVKMIEASEKAQESLNARVEALTNGYILKGTQREKIKEWLTTDAFQLVDMKAETLRKALRDADAGRIVLTSQQREMIELRLLSAKSSIAKCRTALNTAGPGARIRHSITYGGGGRNLRFSHKGFQPGNMPRPSKQREAPEEQMAVVEALQGDYAHVLYGDEAMAACADAIRGLVVAADGHSLYAVDWSNIEGRMLAWYANEEWKLQAYRDLDAGVGVDMYKLIFHKMMGTPIEQIDSFLRQQGKGADLSMGYGGGVGAFVNIANSYQLDLVELGKSAPKLLSAEYMERGARSWKWAVQFNDTHDLPEDIYIACAALKHAYRDACPNIARLWSDLEECAFAAVRNPGKAFVCARGKVTMACDSKLDWLAVQIPTGRQIMFARPRISVRRRFDKDGNEQPPEEALTCMKGEDGAWHRMYIYGGYIANAITQGGCRDLLVQGMLDVEADGFPIIMDIHDEIIAELADDEAVRRFGSCEAALARMTQLMLRERPGLEGLPLAASGHVLKRYRKG